MKRLLAACTVTCAAGAGVAGIAVGQGTGGTVGPKAVGSTTFEVRFSERGIGFHCADTNNRRACARQRNPKIGTFYAGNGAVLQGGKRVGRAHFSTIVTQQGRRADGLFNAAVRLPDGTLSLGGLSAPEGEVDTATITGGTGAYAGARGYTTERELRGGQAIEVTVTFIP